MDCLFKEAIVIEFQIRVNTPLFSNRLKYTIVHWMDIPPCRITTNE